MRIHEPSHFYFVKLPILVLLAVMIGMGLFSKRGFLDYRRMTHQNEIMQKRIETMKENKALLQHQLEALGSVASEQERVIRQTLGFVRSNELVVEFD